MGRQPSVLKGPSASVGVGLAVSIVFLILKLAGVVHWSWIWITVPLWIGFAVRVVEVGLRRSRYGLLVMRGLSLAKKGEYEEALDCFDRILDMEPTDVAVWYEKGASLYNLRRYKEALPCFERALELSPDDEQALEGKRRCHEVLSQADKVAALLSPPHDVFVSYKSEDVDLAREVADQLIASGIKAWFAEYHVLLQNYDEFHRAIEDGILHSSYGLAFTNDRYADSDYCSDEMAQLLRHCGPDKVLEIRIGEGEETHRKFQGLDHSPQMTFDGQIGRVLSFIRSQTGWPVHVTEPIDQPASHHDYQVQGRCTGRPYHLDLAGWDLIEKGAKTVGYDNIMGPTFKLTNAEYPTFVNMYAGPELSRDAIRHDMDDRRMYEQLMAYAPRHLERLDANLRGLHLFFHNGVSQMALTYWMQQGFWTRKYSIILPHPEGKGAAEFVFTFGFSGPFQAYCRHVYKMDRLVKSLIWT